MSTKIEWCDETLNPLGWGCYGPGGTPEKPAICPGCYAYEWAKKGRRDCPDCTAFRPHWHPEQLSKPLHWRKPRAIFWQDMGDLWHKYTPVEYIFWVLDTIRHMSQHTHLFLTKNPARYLDVERLDPARYLDFERLDAGSPLPKINAFYGVTVRDQEEADRLIPVLLKLAALGFKVFISYEPAWGPVDFQKIRVLDGASGCGALSGIISGGMTGKNARPAHPDWFRSVRNQCAAADVPFFFKGWGEWEIASDDNGRVHGYSGSMMPADNPKFCWVNFDGTITRPSGKGTAYAMAKVGRKASGRLLDGSTHDELPWKVSKDVKRELLDVKGER